MCAPEDRCQHELIRAQCADCRRRTRAVVRLGEGGPIVGHVRSHQVDSDGNLRVTMELDEGGTAVGSIPSGVGERFMAPAGRSRELTWIEARFAGRCAECGEWFDEGDEIARWPDGAFGWIARCCE